MKAYPIKLLAGIFFISICSAGLTQQRLPCGNGRINDSALNVASRYERSANRVQTVDYLVRVWFHVFHDNDGTQGAATRAQINSEFTSLLASYAADNVCFLFAGIDSANSTALNRNFNADSDPNGAALSGYQVPGCINVFYLRKINGNNTACSPPCGYGGIALGGIPGTFCLVSTGNIGPGNSIGHEVGHCLGLLHTFETAFGLEKINGTNSTTTGDRVSDTPADPFAYQGNACYSTNASGCAYTGTCTDPASQTNFTPPYTNLMSYWWTGASGVCVSNPTASTGQFDRVDAMLDTYSPLVNCTSPASVTQTTITVLGGYFMKSAINTLTTSGNVIISGASTATFGGGLILLEPGFLASPTGTGLTRVIPKPCN
jgi:hypothetical protein